MRSGDDDSCLNWGGRLVRRFMPDKNFLRCTFVDGGGGLLASICANPISRFQLFSSCYFARGHMIQNIYFQSDVW